MSTESFTHDFERETQTTRAFLERIPSEQLAWRPHPRSFTAGGLGSHIVECVRWVERIFTADETDIDPGTFQPFQAASLNDLLMAYDQSVAKGAEILARVDAATLVAPWRLKVRGKARFERPRIDAGRDFTLHHMIHHRGQLSVYLRLLEARVPGAYGPSADDARP